MRPAHPQLKSMIIILAALSLSVWVGGSPVGYTIREFCLLLAGGLALIQLVFLKDYRHYSPKVLWLLGLALSLMLLTVIASSLRYQPLWQDPLGNPGWPNALWGFPACHPGWLTIVSSILIGLTLDTKRLLKSTGTYYFGVAYATAGLLLFGLSAPHQRLIGLDLQANSTALALGLFWILGWQQSKSLPRNWLIAGQGIIGVALLLTQSRLMIAGTLAITAGELYLYREKLASQWRVIVMGFGAALVVATSLLAARLRWNYLTESLAYRLDLWGVGLKMAGHAQPLGDGAGSIANSLLVYGGQHGLLAQTVKQNNLFESTHNLLIDRSIEWGIAGLALYVGVIIGACRIAFRSRRQLLPMIGLVLLYAIFNNSLVSTELLFWIVMLATLQVADER